MLQENRKGIGERLGGCRDLGQGSNGRKTSLDATEARSVSLSLLSGSLLWEYFEGWEAIARRLPWRVARPIVDSGNSQHASGDRKVSRKEHRPRR